MPQSTVYDNKTEQALMTEIWDPAIAEDPFKFVMFIYPWGKKGTPLEHHDGPRTWQRDDLLEIAATIRENKEKASLGLLPEMFRKSTVSGRGPGKSSLVAWLTHWMMSCNLGSTTIVTANTEQQLKSRTWAELGKWHTLSLNSHWFEMSAMSLRPAPWFQELLKRDLKIDTGYYYAQAQLWSEENPDAFAGVHNPNGVLEIMDEASGIPEAIWKVSEGFFTEPVVHRYWCVFSNGRRNTGAFYETHHSDSARWRRRQLDSRTVEGVDLGVLQGIIDRYGVDSDEARVEVYGQFPDLGDNQFISRMAAQDASLREIARDEGAALIMGVDVARSGRDKTVIRFRQGRDGRTIPPVKFSGLDNMQVADRVADLINRFEPDAVNIDAGGGTGVIDRLRQLGYRVNEVWFGSKASEMPWGNLRIEMWARVRDWLQGAMIDADPALLRDLAAPEKRQPRNSDLVYLESKDDMTRRGLPSPDDGDALALTFAVPVARRDARVSRSRYGRKVAEGVEYDIFGFS